MAGRKKGTPKTGGRIKGAVNRTTKEARDVLEQVLLNQVDNIKDSLDSLKNDSDAKYIDACSKLFAYVLPKKTDVTSGGEILNPPTIIFNRHGNTNSSK
jgi:hypothetical protein